MGSGLFDLTGRVAVITGGTKGMGLAVAKGMAQHGARVIASSRKQDACEAAAAECNEAAGNDLAVGFAANAGRKEELQALVDKAGEFGGADIVWGNAGVNPHYGDSSTLSDEQWDKTMATNVRSNHWLTHMVAPGMKEKGSGSIFFTASVAAFHPSNMLGVYGVSKIAVLGLMRNLALELGPHGIRVNAICPGLIKTDFAKALWENPEAEKKVVRNIPLGRLGESEDLTGTALYLASDASKYITGQALTVCGGSYMWR
ncbi:MAG: SDR family oxidoreductase [Pseudomonadota bacterium]